MVAKRQTIRPFGLVANVRGMDEQRGVFFAQPDGARWIQNLHVGRQGEFTAHRQGCEDLTAELEGGATVTSLDVTRSVGSGGLGTSTLLCAVNGVMKRIHPESGVVLGDIAAGLPVGQGIWCQTFKGAVYMTSAGMAPLKWTGTGSSVAAGGFPIGPDLLEQPALVATFANRLVYARFEGFASHIALSDDLSPETFTLGVSDTDGLVAQVNPGDGEGITALKELYVPSDNDSYLVIFKENSIWALTGKTPLTSALIKLNGAVGALNQRCVVELGSDLVFIGSDKQVHSLTSATASGNIRLNPLGADAVKDVLADMNLSRRDKAWAVHLPTRREVWFGIPTGSSTVVDTILVYRYPTSDSELPVWTVRTGMDTTCAVVVDQGLLTGSSNGRVQRWFSASQYAGVGYEWRYRYPFFDFGAPGVTKRVLELFAWFVIRQDTAVTLQYTWRQSTRTMRRTLAKSVTIPSLGRYGTAVFGLEAYNPADDERLVKVKIPVLGNGEQLQLEAFGTTGALGPTFLGFTGLVAFGGYGREG
jgi:hypothetical protein